MSYLYKLKDRLKKSELINDSFWAIFGNIIGKGLSLASAIIIARILGKEVYGELGMIGGTIVTIMIFSNFGLNYTTTKYIAEYKRTKPELLPHIIKSCQKLTLIFGGISTLTLILVADYVAIYLLKSPQFSFPLRLIAISILFGSLSKTQAGILAGFGKFKALAKINTIIGVITFVSGVLLTYFYNFIGAIIASIIMHFMNYLLNRYFIKEQIKSTLINKREKFSVKEILNFSIPVALQEAFYSVITYSFSLLLVQYSNYGEVGLNSAAVYWSAIILFIPGVLRNVILSHLSSNLNDKKRHLRILRIILLFNFSITFFLSIIIYFLSDFILLSYGDNFSGLKEVVNISVFTTIFISMSNVYAQAYMSENKNWLMLIFRILRDGSILIIAYYLIRKNDGIDGALSLAKSTLYSSILFLALMGVVYELKIKKT